MWSVSIVISATSFYNETSDNHRSELSRGFWSRRIFLVDISAEKYVI